MRRSKRFFRAAGYLFTWSIDPSVAEVPIEMWREHPVTHERYWVTRSRCAPTRHAAYGRALALVAWLRSLSVPRREDPQAQAVLEQLALLSERVAKLDHVSDPRLGVAMGQLLEGKAAAA